MRGAPRCGGSQRAFTLLEMVVALAVFAVIGVLSSRILVDLIDLSEAARRHGGALAELQRAVAIVERDVEQLVHRGVRDELGTPTYAVSISGTTLIEFTRAGWQNPLGARRAELQRVAYALQEDRLVRLFWPVLDRAPGSRPVAQVLLAGVQEATFTGYDMAGERHAYWPADAPAGEAEAAAAPVLAAVALRLGHADHGRIERLWLVPTEPGFVRTEPDAAAVQDGEPAPDP